MLAFWRASIFPHSTWYLLSSALQCTRDNGAPAALQTEIETEKTINGEKAESILHNN